MVKDLIDELGKEKKENEKNNRAVIRYCHKILQILGDETPNKIPDKEKGTNIA